MILLAASVTLIMFAVYATILSMIFKKVTATGGKFAASIAALGLAFGMLSYAAVVGPLNSIEASFMYNQGLLHVLFVGPIQEEIAKFACLILAYLVIARRLHLSSRDLSSVVKGKSLVILGAFVGLAFAMLENLIDYGNLTTAGILIRTAVSWPFHMITIAISAYGFSKYRITRQPAMVLGPLLWAIVSHIIFNTVLVIFRPF